MNPITVPGRNLWQLPRRQIVFSTRPLVMGIVNVTPDSFSDGGQFATPENAVAHALRLVEEGADLLDIGGESTRPGAEPVSVDDELRRVVPVVQALAGRVTVPISVDTSKAAVARACLSTGAEVINDVTALAGDPDMVATAQDAGAGVILMHMQGTPRTMQQNPNYEDVVGDIKIFLDERLKAVTAAGLNRSQAVLDPGIGFGKTQAHNLELLARLDEFRSLGRPVCLGVSRKGGIGKILNRPVGERLFGSLAVLCHAMSRHAVQIIRVHDVAATRDVVRMWEAIEAQRTNREVAAPARDE
jgi:dihydropteroate synthase